MILFLNFFPHIWEYGYVFNYVGHMRCIKSNYFCWISNNGNPTGYFDEIYRRSQRFHCSLCAMFYRCTVTEATWLLLFQLHTFSILYLASLEKVEVYLLVWIKIYIKKWRYFNFSLRHKCLWFILFVNVSEFLCHLKR